MGESWQGEYFWEIYRRGSRELEKRGNRLWEIEVFVSMKNPGRGIETWAIRIC
jgi:hypothetical protein